MQVILKHSETNKKVTVQTLAGGISKNDEF